MSTRRFSATNAGAALVAALAERDFDRLAGTLAPDVRMRALIPPGPVELSGAEPTVARFASWFGEAEGLELVHSVSDEVGDRLHVAYRLRVKRLGDPWKVVEQHLFCTLDGGRIAALDLVCSGFRPDAATLQRRDWDGKQGLVAGGLPSIDRIPAAHHDRARIGHRQRPRTRRETMKALLKFAGVLAAVVVAAPTALAGPFITDTLGGNGHAKVGNQGYRFITDTLGGNGHAKAVRGYRFITDTLAPGGGSLAASPSPRGFSWPDAAIGAGTLAGALIVLGAALLAVRRRDALPV
jgi:hypothetical protein